MYRGYSAAYGGRLDRHRGEDESVSHGLAWADRARAVALGQRQETQPVETVRDLGRALVRAILESGAFDPHDGPSLSQEQELLAEEERS